MNRCDWAQGSEEEIHYHDKEWGVPVHDDQRLFEFLILEGAQAGLSWVTVLKKRENYRKAFDDFNAEKIAGYSEKKVARLLENPGIIRNRLKINATLSNARCFLEVQKEMGSFDQYIWSFVDHKPIINQWRSASEVPVSTEVSNLISKDLKKRGFKFVGSTICYAYMQAVGMVNDHIVSCFRHNEVQQ